MNFRRERLWVFISSVIAFAIFPVGLAAQASLPSMGGQTQGSVYGPGARSPLEFAGEAPPPNEISLDFGAAAFYDDNVLATNSHRIGDEALSFSSRLGVTESTDRLTFNFNYVPFFILYRQTSGYDQLNHAATLGATYQLTDRFSVALYDNFSYQNGLLPSSITGEPILSGTTSPTSLNEGIYPYTSRTLSNTVGLGLTFVKSYRSSYSVFAGYNRRQFGNESGGTVPLYNTDGVSGGLEYKYRLTEHTNLGFLLLHQDNTYRGGEILGSEQRTQIESAYLSVGSRLSPTVSITLFGGPQYVTNLDQSSPQAGVAGGFQGSGGGNITKEVGRTALNLSIQRSVSDGGGLYTSVISSNVSLGARRQLFAHWEARLHVGASQAEASSQLEFGRLDALNAGIGFIRPLRGNAEFQVSYNTIHELSKGTLPIFANFDRNQLSVGIDYRFKAIPLGR